MRVYIIGSVANYDTIRTVAHELQSKTKYVVKHVQPQPDVGIADLISQCFTNIEKSSIIVAIKNKAGVVGNGTQYEIEYARRLGCPIIITAGKDIDKLIHTIKFAARKNQTLRRNITLFVP